MPASKKVVDEGPSPPEALIPADHPDSIKFWGKIFQEGSDDAPMLRRLVISIFDHVRNTADAPVKCSDPRKAHSFLNSKMMMQVTRLFQLKSFVISDQEKENINAFETAGALVEAYCIVFDIPHVSNSKGFPFVLRSTLYQWVVVQIMNDPDESHRIVNEIISNQARLFIDPMTEAPWKHLIPRSAWLPSDKGYDAELKTKLKKAEEVWIKSRTTILAAKRKEAAAKRAAKDAATRQAAINAAELALANAQLEAARMRARALGVGGFHTSYSGSSGTQYVYRRRDEPGNF